ncbi:unnamed protein product [Amoebophrya sp. A25]|nr:unnamed protein product [Amoebophrya sp. A25]|eukprot:GSA25T00004843001.1
MGVRLWMTGAAAASALQIAHRKSTTLTGTKDLMKTFIEFKKQDCTNGFITIQLNLNTIGNATKRSYLMPTDTVANQPLSSQDKLTQIAANECYPEPDCGGFVYMNDAVTKTSASGASITFPKGRVYFLRSDPTCTEITSSDGKTTCVRASHCVEDPAETTYIQKDIFTTDDGTGGLADTTDSGISSDTSSSSGHGGMEGLIGDMPQENKETRSETLNWVQLDLISFLVVD